MINSREQLEQWAAVDPKAFEWLAQHPPPPPQAGQSTVDYFRVLMQTCDDWVLENLPASEDGIVEEVREVTMRDGTLSVLRITKPAIPPAEGSPLFVWIFGGGWVGGSPIQARPRARQLVKLFGCVVCAPTYRLTPEDPFPTPPQDVYDHLKWIASNAENIGADPKLGFIIGGVSAGANMSCTSIRRAHVEERLAHPITGQYFECLYIFPEDDMVPEPYKHLFLSRVQGENAPFVNTPSMRATPVYTKWDPKSTTISPINYPESYEGMPPAYFSVDGADPMRDDSLIYDEILKADGVRTRVDLYTGQPHAHILFMPDSEAERKATVDGFFGVAWLLGKEVTAEQIAAAEPVRRK